MPNLRLSLPNRIQILEVGPRDGFQNLDGYIPTDNKINIISKLVLAGITRIEATAFVSPKWVPQLKDASEVIKTVKHLHPGVSFSALIPNIKGYERAIDAGVDEVVLVVCTTETLNYKNFNRSPKESCEELQEIVANAMPSPIRVRATVAAAFGCPYEGHVSWQRTLETVKQVEQTGVVEIGLADTTGLGHPTQVLEYLQHLKEAEIDVPLSAHFHDTLGVGSANILMAASSGINIFESSIAGLGGCPFAPGAPGNVATESIVYLFEKMGVKTGIDLEAVLSCADKTREIINELVQ
jgi:hydroxymethylglutaryl-CoA lyase